MHEIDPVYCSIFCVNLQLQSGRGARDIYSSGKAAKIAKLGKYKLAAKCSGPGCDKDTEIEYEEYEGPAYQAGQLHPILVSPPLGWRRKDGKYFCPNHSN